MGSENNSRVCSCGSGKTFQQCCGQQNVISFYRFVQLEIEELEQRLLAFTMNELELPFAQTMEEAMLAMDVPEESDVFEMVMLFIANWVAFTRPVVAGKTVVDLFINRNKDRVKRPLLKHALPLWKHAKPYIYRIVKKESNHRIVVQPLFREEQMKVVLFEADHDITEGFLLLGVLVPIGLEYTFFMTYLDNHPNEAAELTKTLLHLMNEYEEHDFEKLIEAHFPVVLDAFLFESCQNTFGLNRLSASQKKVAVLFQRRMEASGMLESYIHAAFTLWCAYCRKQNPIIAKPNVYAAALHYLIEKVVFGENEQVKSHILKEYGVTKKRLCQACREFERVLQLELKELYTMIEM